MSKVKVYAVGDARIVSQEGAITPSSQTLFALALYLVFERGTPIARSKLESILWPGVSTAKASHRLRQSLFRLRQLGIPVESIGKSQIRCEVTTDFDYEELGRQESNADTLGSSSLVPFAGYDPELSSEFAEWLDARRSLVVSVIAHPLLARLSKERSRGDWAKAELIASTLLRLDSMNEEATLALAEAMAMRGSKQEASRLLDRYLQDTGRVTSELATHAKLLRKRIADAAPIPPTSLNVPLVGRASTMNALASVVQTVRTGHTRLVMLVGDAGIGKTRVLSELAQFAALKGFTSVRVNVRPSYAQRPLSTFVILAPILLTLPGAIGCTAETLRFLDLLTKHDPTQDGKAEYPGDAAWIFSGIQRALFDLIDAVAEESPLLIQLEDAQWMDSASLDVLRELIPRLDTRRVLFSISTRSILDEGQPLAGSEGKVFHLAPLDSSDSRDLLSKALAQAQCFPEDQYCEWCVRVAEGNPYFLIELANHWIDGGTEHHVPPSLSSLLLQRISRLDNDSLQVLQTCALLENNSTISRIEAVLEYDAHNLLRCINRLGAADMIVSEISTVAPNGEQITTKHELVSNVALGQLAQPAKRFLHRRIGHVLEREVDDNFSAQILWDCAKHWQLAGDNKRAWHLATSCASHLLKVGLPTAASEAYERALGFCISDEEKIEALSGLATASYRTSAWAKVRDTIAKVRVLQSRSCSAQECHDELELMDLRAQWQTLEWDSVLSSALKCLECETAPASHRAEAGVMALMILGLQGDAIASKRAFATIESIADTVDELTKLRAQMVFHTNFGSLDKGVQSARDLVASQVKTGDIAETFRACSNAGVACRVAGRFEEAMTFFSKALQIADQHNLPGAKKRTIPLIANMALELGKVDEAQVWYERLCEIPIDTFDRYAFVEREGIAMRLALCSGDTEEARKHVPMTLAEASTDPTHNGRSYNLALHIALLIASGDQVPARLIENLDTSFAVSRSGLHQAFTAFVLFTALENAGEFERAKKTLKDYELKYRREPWSAPRHLLATIRGKSLPD